MSDYPLMSIVIASYKRSGYLHHQLNSLRKNINYPNYEIIVSDDGSEENDLRQKITNKFGAKLLLNEHGGMGATFNAAIRVAEGNYLLHLEDDWECTRDCLRHEIQIMQTWDDIGCVRVARSAQRESLPIYELRSLDYGEVVQIIGDHPPRAWAFNGAPRLQLKNIYEQIGYYREDLCPGDADTNLSQRFHETYNKRVAFLKRSFKHFGHHSAGGWREKHKDLGHWGDRYPDVIPMDFDEKIFQKKGLV